MGGLFGSQKVETTNKTILAPEQKELLATAMPWYREFAEQGVKLPEGSGIVPMNDTQREALSGVESAARGGQTQLAQGGLDYTNFLLSGQALDPNTNPGLRGAISAAQRPLYEQLNEQILPNIRGEAVGSGNYGSSRQGIAEGLAAGRTQAAAGDAASNIAFQGYNTGLEATNRALALLPQTMQAQIAPMMTLGSVGDVRQQFEQMMLDETRNRFMQEQLLPVNIGHEILGAVGAIPTAGSSASTIGPGTNPLSAILGLGGLLLGGPFGGLAGGATGGLGGLLGIL